LSVKVGRKFHGLPKQYNQPLEVTLKKRSSVGGQKKHSALLHVPSREAKIGQGTQFAMGRPPNEQKTKRNH